MHPLVSICMPHLNSQPFTHERLLSIVKQSYPHWELIVVDSASTDGSLELLQQYARNDPRIRLFQAPRDGIYSNINRAIGFSTGTYVYIATSDDTMEPECLQQMVETLERARDCDVCHCGLKIIDDQGNGITESDAWINYPSQKYFGRWNRVPHKRLSPHDGLMHFGFFTIYTSLTQLLIRRTVFQEIGFFRTDCGSFADFEWGMRVGLTRNVAHVPGVLATWRRHGGQSTQDSRFHQARANGDFHRFVQKALAALHAVDPKLAAKLGHSQLNHYYLVDELKWRVSLSPSGFGRLIQRGVFTARHPGFVLQWLLSKLVHRKRIVGDFADSFRLECEKLGFSELIVPLP